MRVDPLDVSSDAPAIAACQSGDLSAFDTLYMRYAESVYGYLSRRSPDRETAEDLTSQTFLRALENIRKYDAAKGPLRAWLFTIARNLLTDHFRRDRRGEPIEFAEEVPGDDDVRDAVHVRLQSAQLRDALVRLSPIQREVVTLRVWEGLSYAEIAEITGKKEGHCKVIFSRSLDTLRDHLPLAAFLLFLLAR